MMSSTSIDVRLRLPILSHASCQVDMHQLEDLRSDLMSSSSKSFHRPSLGMQGFKSFSADR